MIKEIVVFVFCIFLIGKSNAVKAQIKVSTSDIDNFWMAYDSVQKVKAYADKINIINNLYIKKGSTGLKEFIQLRNYSDTLWINQIAGFPKFWNSIRQNTLKVRDRVPELELAINNLKTIYPELKEASVYFVIGCLNSGGTTKDSLVLVGCEIATGDKNVDLSEFKNNWLKNIFHKEPIDFVALNVHEYVHTQQKNSTRQVLAHSIHEGSCDFIAELATEKPMKTNYITYGKQHSEEIRASFKKEMFTDNFDNWLYNGSVSNTMPDLGYFVGYEICKAYYNLSEDKKKAVKEIIELDVTNEKELISFLKKSGYYKEGINKEKLVKAYNSNLPYIKKIFPFKNESSKVSSNLKILKVVFSKKMNSKVSINFSKNGKEHFPLKKIIGFEDNGKVLLLELNLKPNTEYDFSITNLSTKSADGYKLKNEEYTVKFKTE